MEGHAVEDRKPGMRHSRRGALCDQERVLDGDLPAHRAQRRENDVERPAGALVPGHERNAFEDSHLGTKHDRLVLDRRRALRVVSDRRADGLGQELGRLQNAQPHEALLVARVERAVDGPQPVVAQLGDQDVLAKLPRKRQLGSHRRLLRDCGSEPALGRM